MNERLKFCLDVGIAIADMHSNCTKEKISFKKGNSLSLSLAIIHGDIKPQNVLIYKNLDEGTKDEA
jgi:serine/threonine protein kinase